MSTDLEHHVRGTLVPPYSCTLVPVHHNTRHAGANSGHAPCCMARLAVPFSADRSQSHHIVTELAASLAPLSPRTGTRANHPRVLRTPSQPRRSREGPQFMARQWQRQKAICHCLLTRMFHLSFFHLLLTQSLFYHPPHSKALLAIAS